MSDDKILKIIKCLNDDIYTSKSKVGKAGLKEINNYIKSLQQEIQQLKEALKSKSYCKYANKCNKDDDCSYEEYQGMAEGNMKLSNENYDLKQQLKQRDEVIDEAIEYIQNNKSYEYEHEESSYLDHETLYELLEILQKYKGDNK